MRFSAVAAKARTIPKRPLSVAGEWAYLSRSIIMVGFVGLFLLLASQQGFACYLIEGGDWGGADFTPDNGDTLSGSFINVGRFAIKAGDTIRAGSGAITIKAQDIRVDGVFVGGTELNPTLNLTSARSITVQGTLDQWSSLTFAGGNVVLARGSISILNSAGDVNIFPSPSSGCVTLSAGAYPDRKGPSGAFIQSADGVWIVRGGSVAGSAVPLPPSLFFLAPALAGTLLMRRGLRRRKWSA